MDYAGRMKMSKILEKIKKMSKGKKIALATLLAITFVGIMIIAARLLLGIFEKLAVKIGFIIITPTVTAALLLCLAVGILWFISSMIFSKNRINSIKDMVNNIYDMLKSFGMVVGGLMADFLLILFACMNFNKIVNITGVHPDITAGALALGIFALSLRMIFRTMYIGNLNYYIRKFLNTDEDVVYED